jgi:hypothetical protein
MGNPTTVTTPTQLSERVGTATGRYRYMPYRGLGHLRLQEECRRSGSALCSYPGSDGLVTFVARAGAEYGILEIDEVRDAPCSQTSPERI